MEWKPGAQKLEDGAMDFWLRVIEPGSSNTGAAHEALVDAIIELRALRATMKRLEEWAESMEDGLDDSGPLVRLDGVVKELRNRMKGDV